MRQLRAYELVDDAHVLGAWRPPNPVPLPPLLPQVHVQLWGRTADAQGWAVAGGMGTREGVKTRLALRVYCTCKLFEFASGAALVGGGEGSKGGCKAGTCAQACTRTPQSLVGVALECT